MSAPCNRDRKRKCTCALDRKRSATLGTCFMPDGALLERQIAPLPRPILMVNNCPYKTYDSWKRKGQNKIAKYNNDSIKAGKKEGPAANISGVMNRYYHVQCGNDSCLLPPLKGHLECRHLGVQLRNPQRWNSPSNADHLFTSLIFGDKNPCVYQDKLQGEGRD